MCAGAGSKRGVRIFDGGKIMRVRPLLIVVSAPSGAGKSTLCDLLLAEFEDMVYSISCTTRAPRGAEVDGRDYFFLTKEEFDRRIKNGEFIEHAVVHGNKYGTLRKAVCDALEKGKSVLMDIDVQGADQIRKYVTSAPGDDLLKNAFLDIFIAPPSLAALRERLERRGEDSSETIERRMRNAEGEMACKSAYRYVVVNDDLNRAESELKNIIIAEQKK